MDPIIFAIKTDIFFNFLVDVMINSDKDLFSKLSRINFFHNLSIFFF